MRALCLALAFVSAPALAEETLFFACSFPNGKAVEVRHTSTTATYAFGPKGRLDELRLTRPVTKVHLTPWPGIGRTIWEEVIFQNAGHSYLVYASIERVYPESETAEIETVVSGGVIVSKGDKELARLDCAPGSADFPWGNGLYDSKEAAGQCYDRVNRAWAAC